MDKFNFSFQNITDAHGVGISITGMLIVFCALSLIAIFIAVLPWVLRKMAPVLPKGMVLHASPKPKTAPAVDEKLIAAIGYALFKEKTKSP